MTGKIPEKHVASMEKYFKNYDNFNCLTITNGLCGLGNWVKPVVNAVGNLAERNYTVESVANVLKLIAEKWDGVELTIHVGGDYESDECIATVILKNGKVDILPPQIEKLPELDEDIIIDRLMSQLMRR